MNVVEGTVYDQGTSGGVSESLGCVVVGTSKVLTETGTPLAKFACMPEVDQNRVDRVSRTNS